MSITQADYRWLNLIRRHPRGKLRTLRVGLRWIFAMLTGRRLLKRGPNAGSRFLLDQDVTTAGRHPDSDIFLDDVTVSRRHAEFRREGSGYTVHDVGSLNGTYVNRERIDAAPLSGGDEVQIGKFRLVYLTAAVRAGVGAQACRRRKAALVRRDDQGRRSRLVTSSHT